MKYYKDAQNNLFGYEEGDNVPAGLMEITMDEVRAIVAVKQQAEFNSLTYADKRAAEYPSIADQLDTMYHGGYDAWKATVQSIKDKYPKPT
jgi:hypothetical protein